MSCGQLDSAWIWPGSDLTADTDKLDEDFHPCSVACPGSCSGDFCCASSNRCGDSCCRFAENRVIAHRGAWRRSGLPENSIAALRHAAQLGCAGTEFDVWMTADDEIVVNHDPHFFRMPIETSTLEELLEKKLFNGESIPTLQEMLLEGKSQKTSRLYVEIKPSRVDYERSLHVAERVVSIVDEVEAHDWVVYISSSYRVLQRVLDLDPEARVIHLAPTAEPEMLREDGFVGAAYEFSVYHENPKLIDDLTDLGLTVGAWTVNDSNLILSFVDAGMDFIATDEPELMLDLYGP